MSAKPTQPETNSPRPASRPPQQPNRRTGEQAEHDRYYARVAARYRLAKYLTLFVLVLVLLAGLIMGSDSITYANFVYLLRDFDTVLDVVGGEDALTLRYSTMEDRQYLAYRDGLTLVSRSGIEIYNAGGKRTLEANPDYADPYAVASARYLLVCDLGGESYTLYNSLSDVFSETLDYPIHGATISDSGHYALITETREYTSAVLLYNKNCKLINRYLKDKYVIDAAISDDGERIAIVSVSSIDGAYTAEFQLCEPGKDTAIATLQVQGVFPLAVRFFDDNSFAVLGDSAMYFYTDRGELINTVSFADAPPDRFVLDGDRAVLVFPGNVMATESRVCVYDSRGETVLDHALEGNVQILTLTEPAAYVMTEREIFRLSDRGEVSSLVHNGGAKALLTLGDDVLLCTASAAYRYSDEQFTES